MTYLAYAGIGSRSTPTHIQSVMRRLAHHLASEGWILRSGGANGADTAFEVGVDDFLQAQRSHGGAHFQQQKEIYLPWVGFNDNPSQLYPGRIPFSNEEIKISSYYHPAWNKCSPSAKLLHQRNLRQIIGHQSVCGEAVQLSKFVVCWTEGGQLSGGTSQALRLARAYHVPVFNLGKANTFDEVEEMVSRIHDIQRKIKEKVINAEKARAISAGEGNVQ